LEAAIHKDMKHFFFTIHKTPKRDEFTTEEVLPILHAHTAYFKELGKQGICLIAGPFAHHADSGNHEIGAGCYIFAAESEAEARKLADADPFCVHGIYDYKIWEWTKVVPEERDEG
jgi:uncharacterized protein YciI